MVRTSARRKKVTSETATCAPPPPATEEKASAAVAGEPDTTARGVTSKTRKSRKKAVKEEGAPSTPSALPPSTPTKTGPMRPFPRLGYACLNTVLRKQKPTVFSGRTCRIATIVEKGMDYVKDLGLQNVRDLEQVVLWNEKQNIRFFRMSSDIFPFAAHPQYGYSLEFAKTDLARVGTLAKRLGHRLTFHPSQFDQLGSPSVKVVDNTVRDLTSHANMLDLMGLDKDSVMILHAGGTFGDKAATLDRWETEFLKMPKRVRDRIVLENDDVSYTVRDILPTCQRLSIPLVFDWHHHDILNEFCPGDRPTDAAADAEGAGVISRNIRDDPELPKLLQDIKETWTRRGIRQKQHYSEARNGAVTAVERRGHSDRVVSIPPEVDDSVDLMIEAKDKEQAVLTIYKAFGVYEVDDGLIWDALPETKRVVDRVGRGGSKRGADDEGEITAGRKRTRKTQTSVKDDKGKTTKVVTTVEEESEHDASTEALEGESVVRDHRITRRKVTRKVTTSPRKRPADTDGAGEEIKNVGKSSSKGGKKRKKANDDTVAAATPARKRRKTAKK